jgi:membrane associated rhomboid family serine protease
MNERIRYIPLYLTAACVIVFIIQNILPVTDIFLLRQHAGTGLWTLFTSVFLHADILHLVYNMIALVLFGLILENIIGSRKFIVIFFVSGIAAGVAAAFFYDASLGASGAIFGVMGCLAALRPRMFVWVLGVPLPMALAAAVWLMIDMLGVISPANVANIAHIAGLLTGITIGLYLRKYYAERRERSKKPLSDEELNRWEKDWM